MSEGTYYGTGRRKSSNARVFMVPGKGDIIVNGNSGDFISGGHIPKILLTWKNSKDINLLFDEIFEAHFYKH